LCTPTPPTTTYPARSSTTARSRSTSRHLSAASSLRRIPVTVTSQTSAPHSSSWSNAAATSRAASSLVGGSGYGRLAGGLTTWSTGLTVIQQYRTPMLSVPPVAQVVPVGPVINRRAAGPA